MTKVLIVDDNPMDRRFAGACVEESGMTATYAENGRDALEKLEIETPDIVLTDLDMPEMDGLQLVRKLQQRDPTLPVILMTAKGSEAVATEALKAGASSYVPKRNFQQELVAALNIVNKASKSRQRQQQVYEFMTEAESKFVLGNNHDATSALVGYFLEAIRRMNLCPEGELVRVGTALSEAMVNAIDHGNLELNSKLREGSDGQSYHELGRQRISQEPYRNRRVFITCHVSEAEAVFTIRDEGPGFDPSTLPDPHDPENLMRPHGRGLMLIRTFMDDVSFSESGNEIRMHKYARSAVST
jgi:CheY-like chemotaxis protein/anti-sigma regulatory factor (Ser/Thr protein kinase)